MGSALGTCVYYHPRLPVIVERRENGVMGGGEEERSERFSQVRTVRNWGGEGRVESTS